MVKKAKIDRQELKEIIGQSQPKGRFGNEWVFQGCPPEFSNCRDINRPNLMIRRLVIPHDRKTPEQIAQRDRFRRGAAAWKLLTPAEKQEYKARARKQRVVSGYILFMREYLNTPPEKGLKGRR